MPASLTSTSCSSQPSISYPISASQSSRKRGRVSSDGEVEEVLHPVPQEFISRYGAHILELEEPVQHWRIQERTLRHERHSSGGMGAVQKEVDIKMRRVVVTWLTNLRPDFDLGSETLFLAVDLLDRYLCRASVRWDEFQLLGAVCLWIAAKYEEVVPPSAQDLVDVQKLVTTADMRRMEMKVLQTLGYQLAAPTPLRFLHYFCVSAGVHCPVVFQKAESFLLVALLDAGTTPHLPSHTAAAALLLALSTLQQPCRLPAVMALVECSPERLLLHARELHSKHRRMAALSPPAAKASAVPAAALSPPVDAQTSAIPAAPAPESSTPLALPAFKTQKVEAAPAQA